MYYGNNDNNPLPFLQSTKVKKWQKIIRQELFVQKLFPLIYWRLRFNLQRLSLGIDIQDNVTQIQQGN